MLGVARALLWIGILLIPVDARASARDDMRAGLSAFDALDYERATMLLSRALTHKQRLSVEDLQIVHKTLAFGYVGMGRHANAVTAFVELLRIEPATELDRTVSPRVRAAFDEARTRLNLSALGTETAARTSAQGALPVSRALTVAPPKPLYKKAWFWGVVAGGVVVVTTAIVLGVTLSQTVATVTVTPQ